MTNQTDRLSGVIGNVAIKAPCRVATTVNLPALSGLLTIDGVVLVAGYRVLVKDQNNQVENGIYVADTGDWERAKDCDGQYDMVQGTLVFVWDGTVNLDTFWRQTFAGTIVPGTTGIAFTASSTALQGVSALMVTLLAATTAASARSILATPSTTEAMLDTDIAAKGDLIVGTANDTPGILAVGADGSILTADSTQSSGLAWVSQQIAKSFAPNPFFQVGQRIGLITTGTDDIYGHDHWYTLTQTAGIAVSTMTLQEDGQGSNARLTQSQAVSQRMGYACIIEVTEAQKLRGKVMNFQPRIRCSSSQAIRCAVLEWTGSGDSVTSDVVNDWTSSTYTVGNFFNSTTLNVLGVSTTTPSAAAWTDTTALPVTIGSSANNIILFVWVEAVAAQNVTLDIGKVRFIAGAGKSDIELPRYIDELNYAKRFFNVLSNTPGGTPDTFMFGAAISTSQADFLYRYPTEMRIGFTPTLDVTLGASGFSLRTTAASSVVTAIAALTGPTHKEMGIRVTGTATPYTSAHPAWIDNVNNGILAINGSL